MAFKQNVNNLVLLGHWNTLLFTPKWLNNNIFNNELPDKINVEVLVHGNNVQKKIIHLPHFKLEVSQEKLCFNLNEYDDDHYQELLNAANTILTKLQHTPLTAIGINFIHIVESDVPFKNANGFYGLENLIQADEHLTIEKTDYSIRIIIIRSNEKAEFNFNCSYLVNAPAQVKEILTAGIFEKKIKENAKLFDILWEKFNG
jgi:hypothetical protein